jgi:hypothetical protein
MRACPMTCTIPEGAEGHTSGAGLQELSGVPLILRAMLDDDERVWRYMLAFDVPIFRP